MLENNEIWKDIKGYPNYQVSNYGRIWSCYSQRYMKPQKNNVGYYYLNLTAANGKHKKELIHRLVALAFIDNPNNLPQVHHINHNPADNRVENLAWVTNTQNNRDKRSNVSIIQYDREGNFIKQYNTITEAAEGMGGTVSGIKTYFYNKYPHYKGFILKKEAKYLEE